MYIYICVCAYVCVCVFVIFVVKISHNTYYKTKNLLYFN